MSQYPSRPGAPGRTAVSLAAILALCACGQVHEADAAEELSFPSPRLTQLRDERAACPVPDTLERACAEDFGSAASTETLRDTYRFLVGRWRFCHEEAFPQVHGEDIGRQQAHDGIEFLNGGRFRLLFEDDAGVLQPRLGLDFEGEVSLGLNGPDSLFLDYDSVVEPQVRVVGSDCPRRLRLVGIAGPTVEYVADDEWPALEQDAGIDEDDARCEYRGDGCD